MDRKIYSFQFNMSDGRQLTSRKMEEDQALYFLISVFGSVQTDGLLSLENGVFIQPRQLCDFVILKNSQPHFDNEMIRKAIIMTGQMLESISVKPFAVPSVSDNEH